MVWSIMAPKGIPESQQCYGGAVGESIENDGMGARHQSLVYSVAFFCACFLACMYAKYEETHHARFTGPAGRAKDRTISPDR